jgi:hypothetical protein
MATDGVPFAPARTRSAVRVRERFQRDPTIQVCHAMARWQAGKWCLRRQLKTSPLAPVNAGRSIDGGQSGTNLVAARLAAANKFAVAFWGVATRRKPCRKPPQYLNK